ncbi:MAG: restriction endonuclease subunit S [Haliea sp.]
MSFPEYPDYKDTGVEWLGQIPPHWNAMPFKWLIDRNDGGAWGDDPTGEGDTVVLRSTDQTVDGQWRIVDPATRALSAREKLHTSLAEGDLVVTKSSGSALHIGKTTLVTREVASLGCCFGNFMQRLRMRPAFLPRLAWYLMNSEIARIQLDLLSNSTTGLANINGTLIGEMQVAVPPHVEQPAIVCFLDHETAKIDALIQEQQRLIELLKEKRQAVISHAVTKGLDPSVPMKDSGVEWLGEVPEHWDVMPAKFLYEFLTSGSRGWAEYYSDGGDIFFRIANLTRSSIRPKLDSIQRVLPPNDAEGARARIKQGDILISITADLGSVCVADESIANGYVSQHVALARTNCQVSSPDWLAFFILGNAAKEQLLGAGYGGTKIQLSLEDVRELIVALPPKDEQRQIASSLVNRTACTELLIDECVDAVVLLQERRSALISAAVTGKIDVRNWQPPADESAFDEEVRQAGLEVAS